MRSKLKTKRTVGPIAVGDVVVYDIVGVVNIIDDYFSSNFTNDTFLKPELVHIVTSLASLGYRKLDYFAGGLLRFC